MLTLQAYQQHRLAVMHPNKLKLFPAATVPVVAKLGYRHRGKRGTRNEERRNARRAHASKQKCRRWRSRGVVEVPHQPRQKNEGKNLCRKYLDMELSERRGAFARKRRRGKRAERKTTRKKHKVARARFRLEELTFGTFNVRIAAVNGVSGTDHIDTLLRPCAAKGCAVIGLQKTKRDGTSKIVTSGNRVFFSDDYSRVKGRKGQHGVGLVIKEELVKKASENGIAIRCISARFLKARILIKSNFVTFVVAYAPTEEVPEGQKAKYMAAINSTVASLPAGEYVFVLSDANTRTRKRGEGGGEADSKVLGG